MKVVLHVEEIFPRVPIYHVAVGYKWGPFYKRYDFHPKVFQVPTRGRKKSVSLGNSRKDPLSIAVHELGVNKTYFLGINDCRHYSQDLLDYTFKEDAPDVVNVLRLQEYFSS